MRKKSIPGRIVVHDRSQVESQVLPRYFNHASFASLRRQLNYFAFSREGKGKQKGATYTNDQVYDLNDILYLKRRLPGSSDPLGQKPAPDIAKKESVPVATKKVLALTRKEIPLKPSSSRKSQSSSRSSKKSSRSKKTNKRARKIIDSVVPVVHLPMKKTKRTHSNSFDEECPTTTNLREAPAKSVSPAPASQEKPQKTNSVQILLDLTKPEPEEYSTTSSATSLAVPEANWFYRTEAIKRDVTHFDPTSFKIDTKKEEDVIAGCSALLSLGWQKA